MSLTNITAFLRKTIFGAVVIASLVSFTVARAEDDDNDSKTPKSEYIPSGQKITPTAVPGAEFQLFNAGLKDFPSFSPNGAQTTVVSPDNRTLLVLLAGYNSQNGADGKPAPDAQSEYIFIYDISKGEPAQKEVIQLPNTFNGIVFSPDGKAFYVGGGSDDNVHSYELQSSGTWVETGMPIKLGHVTTNSLTPTSGVPSTAGLAITPDGKKLVVANIYNDSLSIVDTTTRNLTKEIDLRPGKLDPTQAGVPGGEYPYWVSITANNVAYVSSLRDREIVVLNVGDTPGVISRIKVQGSPNKSVLNRANTRLYVASEYEDIVTVIDTQSNRVIKTISTAGPDYVTFQLNKYRGSAPSSLAFSPDEKVLYVTNTGTNSVAVIVLLAGEEALTLGLLPTQFYPTSVSVSGDGRYLYVVNEKNPAGPNLQEPDAASNQYIFQIEKAGLLSFPVPDFYSLENLTLTVAANNRFIARPGKKDQQVLGELRKRIKHIIYIVKENRTYDQILGDLGKGNGDPALVQFGHAITPNFHKIASHFVDIDNFYDSGDVSGNGWVWSVAGRESDWTVKSIMLNYAGRGFSYDAEGTNRNVNVAYPELAQRIAANPETQNDRDILPGQADVSSPDGPDGEQGTGYLWNATLRKGMTIRDYGFYIDLARYGSSTPIPLERDPHSKNLQVAYATKAELQANLDPFYRGYDNNFPDFYREQEWEREFDQFDQNGELPALEFVRLMHDHMGNFKTAIDGVNTPERQQADNDYAVGKLIERVARSQYKSDTLIFVIEDDAQDGADHVDAHRSTAYVVGPYVKHGAVLSKHYTTVNMVRTIEDILGLEHLSLYTATLRPMTDVFDLDQVDWRFRASPSIYLKSTQLPIPSSEFVSAKTLQPTRDAAYWAEKTAEFDFSKEDNLKDPEKFNRIIWEGLKVNVPYPSTRSGANLRKNRKHVVTNPMLALKDKSMLGDNR